MTEAIGDKLMQENIYDEIIKTASKYKDVGRVIRLTSWLLLIEVAPVRQVLAFDLPEDANTFFDNLISAGWINANNISVEGMTI